MEQEGGGGGGGGGLQGMFKAVRAVGISPLQRKQTDFGAQSAFALPNPSVFSLTCRHGWVYKEEREDGGTGCDASVNSPRTTEMCPGVVACEGVTSDTRLDLSHRVGRVLSPRAVSVGRLYSMGVTFKSVPARHEALQLMRSAFPRAKSLTVHHPSRRQWAHNIEGMTSYILRG